MIATFVAPLAECFDRWDAPGLDNDTEFALFLFVFLLCLVLVVAMLVAMGALERQCASRIVVFRATPAMERWHSVMRSPVSPHTSPPLRI